MNPQEMVAITLPIDGMTCGGCAANVEKSIQALPGISRAVVFLLRKQANIVYDPAQVDLLDFHRAIADAGYSVPTQESVLDIPGMSCVSCIVRVEGALTDLPGMLEASANLTKNTARVKYIPQLTTLEEMQQAVQKAGYQATLSTAAVDQPQEKLFDSSRIGRLKKLFQRG